MTTRLILFMLLMFNISLLATDETKATNDSTKAKVVDAFALAQNYPNPFNPSTTIQFSVPEAANVDITIYDLLGNAMKNITRQHYSAGTYSLKIDATEFPAGVYFYTMTAGDFTATRRMTLIK